MRIVINYDLMDKILEANNGYSLKRCIKRSLGFTSISTIIGTVDNIFSGDITPELFNEVAIYFVLHSMYTGIYAHLFRDITRENAKRNLSQLVQQLRNSCIKTDDSSILEAYRYKTEYDVHMGEILPTVEQKKYINVPIKNEFFGDKEISLIQEHVIGSSKYILSMGEVEDKKVYSLGMNKMLGR